MLDCYIFQSVTIKNVLPINLKQYNYRLKAVFFPLLYDQRGRELLETFTAWSAATAATNSFIRPIFDSSDDCFHNELFAYKIFCQHSPLIVTGGSNVCPSYFVSVNVLTKKVFVRQKHRQHIQLCLLLAASDYVRPVMLCASHRVITAGPCSGSVIYDADAFHDGH